MTVSTNGSAPLPPGPALMLYDGVCGVCNGWVHFVMKRDLSDRIRFAPQQSALAETVLLRHGVDCQAMLAGNSVYLALDYGSPREALLTESDVTVHVLLLLGGRWGFFGRVLGLVPRPLRNLAYRLFARNRFRFSERYESCPLPAPADRAKFLA